MSRRKKGASHFNKAVTRLAALKSIDEKMDLGNGLTVMAYEAAMQEFRSKLDDYNTLLSTVDEGLSRVKAGEVFLKDLSERMLAGVASRYSKNSDEYLMAGGVKKSERKKKTSHNKKDVA